MMQGIRPTINPIPSTLSVPMPTNDVNLEALSFYELERMATKLRHHNKFFAPVQDPIWTELATAVFPRCRQTEKIAADLAHAVQCVIKSNEVKHIVARSHTTNILNKSSIFPIYARNIKQILIVLGPDEEESIGYYEKYCSSIGMSCKMIMLDDAENYLPHLEFTIDYIGNEKNTLIYSTDKSAARACTICTAYAMMVTADYNFSHVIKHIIPAFPRFQLTEDLTAQLKHFGHQMRMRCAKIMPVNRLVCSPKRRVHYYKEHSREKKFKTQGLETITTSDKPKPAHLDTISSNPSLENNYHPIPLSN